MAIECKLPELGENVTSGTVSSILVKEGDKIEKDQSLIEIETEKAVAEVPAESGGTVKKILVKEGDEIKVGQTIVELEAEGEEEAKAEPQKQQQPEAKEEKEEKTGQAEEQEHKEPVEKQEKPAKEEAPAEEKAEKLSAPPQPEEKPEKPAEPKKGVPAPAAPSVRRSAREIGIDIHDVPGTGPGGRISIDDVKAFSKKRHQEKTAPAAGIAPAQAPLPDFTKWGDIDRQPMTQIRKTATTRLTTAWTTIPHVTQHDKADITELNKLRKQYSPKAEKAGGKLTVTAIIVKVVAAALKVFPQFNASLDVENKEVIYKKYYSVGLAVDTENGLLVPVIRDVDQKNLIELSVEISEIAQKARDRKLSLDDMQGANITVSNLGGIGGAFFTPVINPPEVAILGVSRGTFEPVYQDGEWQPRLMIPLSLSYDHRLIDGADGARFLRWVCEALEKPFTMMLEG